MFYTFLFRIYLWTGTHFDELYDMETENPTDLAVIPKKDYYLLIVAQNPHNQNVSTFTVTDEIFSISSRDFFNSFFPFFSDRISAVQIHTRIRCIQNSSDSFPWIWKAPFLRGFRFRRNVCASD